MKKIELKAKRYATKYIENNFNGAKTMKQLNPTMSNDVAKSGASEILANPYYQKEIITQMEEIGLDDKLINRITKRNIKQKSSTSASNQAIDIYHKVKGTYAPLRKESINITLTGKDLDAKIADKIRELQSLQAQTGA